MRILCEHASKIHETPIQSAPRNNQKPQMREPYKQYQQNATLGIHAWLIDLETKVTQHDENDEYQTYATSMPKGSKRNGGWSETRMEWNMFPH